MDSVAPNSSSIGEECFDELENQQQALMPSPGITFNRSEIDYRRISSNLVPLIDPADALQQLSRMDVVLVDMRSKDDYNRFVRLAIIAMIFLKIVHRVN